MAAAAATIRGMFPAVERRSLWTGTPEIYFSKAIDNSRLVKVEDPRRNREMKQFGTALACLFLLVFTYAWQHFRAIEYGYQIESAKRELNNLTEMNRALRLEDASLRDPERIDVMARRMGLVPPEPGQVIRMDGEFGDAGAPVVASASPILVMAGGGQDGPRHKWGRPAARPDSRGRLSPHDLYLAVRLLVGRHVCLRRFEVCHYEAERDWETAYWRRRRTVGSSFALRASSE